MRLCEKTKVLAAAAIFFANFQTTFAAPNPVAVITNYDDIPMEIAIQRANGESDGSEALLYPDDVITGNILKIEVNCSPYAEARVEGNTCRIFYNPPSEIWQIADNITDYVLSFWQNVENTTTGASRGNNRTINLTPQPGFNVTVLMNEDISFAWDNLENKKFTIKNQQGKIIYEQNIDGVSKISVHPKSIGLEYGKQYIWNMDSDFMDYKISVLDEKTESTIMDNLRKIDAEDISPENRILKKSKYIQILSDIYPDKLNLYWLSAKWLESLLAGDSTSIIEKEVMLKKCMHHLDQEMQRQ